MNFGKDTVQKRLDKNPQAMRQRRETAEHPSGYEFRKGQDVNARVPKPPRFPIASDAEPAVYPCQGCAS
jgi:hypothetical protein